MYLAVLLDLFNREVVGWSASSRMTRQLAMDALQMALGRRNPGKALLHHIRIGAASTLRPIIRKFSKIIAIICSMSRKGNCYDNAVAESFFGRLKSEWVNHQSVP